MPILLETSQLQQKFYQSLTETSNSLALSQLWLLKIPGDVVRSIDSLLSKNFNSYEGFTSTWDIFSDSSRTLNTRWFIGDTYYMLARAVTFPGDSISVSHAGPEQSGFLAGSYTEGRAKLNTVNIVLLETNQSIADLFFRPWLIMVGYKSLKDFSLRMNIELDCFQKDGVDKPIKLRKTIRLQDAAPITVDQEEFNYSADKLIDRTVELVYKRYNIVARSGESVFKDEEQYKKLSGESEPSGIVGIIDGARRIVDGTNRVYSQVLGTAEQIRAAATTGLRAVGLDSAANKTDVAFNKARETIRAPINTVITTSNRVINSVEGIVDAGRDIAGT